MARAVGLPSCAFRVMGTGMYWIDPDPGPDDGDEIVPPLAYWPAASFS